MITSPTIRKKALQVAEQTGRELVESKSNHLRVVFKKGNRLDYCKIVMDTSGYIHFVHYRTY